MSATAWAWLVLLLPLLGSIVIGLGFRVLPARAAGIVGTAAIGLAFACGIAALLSLLGEHPEARHHASSLWDYASVAGLDIKLGIYVDPLSAFMVLVVTGVSTLIHLYSFGYMAAPTRATTASSATSTSSSSRCCCWSSPATSSS